MEHRWGERYDTSVDVKLRHGNCHTERGRLVNFSSSGAFVETNQVLPPLSHLVVELYLPLRTTNRKVTLTASVIRADREGVGIEWCDPLPFETRWLESPRTVRNTPISKFTNRNIAPTDAP